ncbi:MAG: 1-(5-phosphoribosyl)-5-[(5-phosphoribosylamino)methylideneamino]imidazole-4-carboxamide isomerase [Clostridiales bacterium]|nr:1-(5-phosphoribosyl)-5-[(5-phosphoribosylamino)methylideneamino]imidazole-4-carboxamide isomerase [Clostridiales bacterium]
MILYPAIDMLDGKAVRLRQGKRDDVTVYGDPVEMSAKWRAKGAQWLHLVDLTAAFEGKTAHLPLIREVVAAFDGQVELGGGLRTMQDIELRVNAGVKRCIIGTAAAENPELVREACREFPGCIAVGIDAKNGLVATRGWVETSALTAVELALRMRDMGVRDVIYTDISRDGMMQGPNVEATRRLIEQTGMDIIGSGGVSCLNDLGNLMAAGCAGAILGRAMYEGAFTLEEALAYNKEA